MHTAAQETAKGKENGEPTSPSHMDPQSECLSTAEVTTTITLLEYWARISATAWQPSWSRAALIQTLTLA